MTGRNSTACPRSGFEEGWRQRFTERGRRFQDDAGIAGWSRSGLDARFRRFLALWPGAAAGSRWLDAGCGAGTYTRHLAAQGVVAVGLDYSPPSLEKARTRSPAGSAWIAGDVKRLPFAPGSFDGVLCLGVLQALEDPEPALERLVAALRPGGVLWIDALNGAFLPHAAMRLYRRLRGRPPHLHYWTPTRLRRNLEAKAGTKVELHWMPLAPGRWPGVQRLLESRPFAWTFRRIPLVGLLWSHSFILVVQRG